MKSAYKSTFKVQIVTPIDHVYSGSIVHLSVKGSEGDLGICYGHAPLLTGLLPSMLTMVKKGGEKDSLYVAGGFMEVQPNNVSILADTLIRAKDIDEKKAQEARRNAEKRLQNCDVDQLIKCELQLMKAIAKLRVARSVKQY
ncbi:F0F1 ATP synthase subunit epsilon [Alteromonas sediminis]|uniref:ATP synthase epsilon chain n=1 Tax=Alteromonas sediminis TaxID=2259342 RepID=A0A3N5Y5A1_9ALTE|nr:ATP synthase F1 subunit epsilon [Alteromonas sediminis]RPJ68186.1 F0F1 ATP synthase subunit epsilon [Alteromonas sediminis]